MPTIKYKPTTNGRRNMTGASFEEITKFSPEKSLITVKKKHSGRNSYGRITVRHKGGGNRQKYRIIAFKRLGDAPKKVIGVEYDPNRTAYIALLQDEEGNKMPYQEFIASKIDSYRRELEETYWEIVHMQDCEEAKKEKPESVTEG